MKYISFVMILMLCTGCIRHYSTYRYDNGEDYVQEGIIRIVNDDNGKIGYATAEGVIEVPYNAFIPEPEVTSKVITLKIREEPPVEVKDKEVMFRIIKCAFMQRRKTLMNALVNAKVFLNKEEAIQILKEIGLPENIRAEKLTLQDFANIANLLVNE